MAESQQKLESTKTHNTTMAQTKPNIFQITHPSISIRVPSLGFVGMASSAANQEKNKEQVAKLFGEPQAKQQKIGFLKIDKETQSKKTPLAW